MKWIPALILSLAMLGAAHAAGPDDQYLEIYNLIQQADGLNQAADARSAAAKYVQAQSGLKKLQEIYPSWNPDIVKYRLEYVSGKLAEVAKVIPQAPAPAKTNAAPRVATLPELQGQISDLAEQVRVLAAEKTDLERKLKEALTVKPVADPELAKAQEEVLALKKERDLLNTTLEMERAAARANAPKAKAADDAAAAQAAQALQASKERAELQAKLDVTAKSAEQLKSQLIAANNEINGLKQAGEQVKQAQAAKEQLEKECAELKKKLADSEAKSAAADQTAQIASATEQLKAAQAAKASLEKECADLKKKLADSEAQSVTNAALSSQLAIANVELAKSKTSSEQLKEAQAAKTKLEKENEDLKKKVGKKGSKGEDSEVVVLRARLAALEATPVPYTAEEQALLKTLAEPKAATVQVAMAEPTNAAPVKKAIRSAKDLPAGAGAMMADAQRSFATGDFAAAEKKYKDVLRQDEKNVYVLSHLANAQMAQNHFDDAEATIQKSLKLDPDDAATLLLLGNLRLRQDKVNEALDALSHSVAVNPTNAVSQNSLGSALSRKGDVKAAETALRKALQLDSRFPEAHNNLAIVYATQKPPSMELARWHYKKARDNGQPRNPDLEKILDAATATVTNAPAASDKK